MIILFVMKTRIVKLKDIFRKIAALNRARAKGTEDAPLEDTVPHGDGSAEDEVLRRERQAKLRAAIAGLPVYERELFYRKYYYCPGRVLLRDSGRRVSGHQRRAGCHLFGHRTR